MTTRNASRFFLLVLFPVLLLGETAFAAEGFPHRAEFSDVEVVELDDLKKIYNDVVIVDVRSEQEFYVIHINKALNYNMKHPEFIDNIAQLRSSFPDQKIVFYCNGHTCKKSYQAVAAVKAAMPEIQNIAAFDTGVFDWAKKYPDLTTLLGETPMDPGRLIPKEALNAKKIDYNTMMEFDKDPKVVFIDIRDGFQRDYIPAVKPLRHIPFDRFLDMAMKDTYYRNKKLVFMDSVGKQVRWLQYLLEKLGYENYHFLDGGVDGIKR